MENNARVYTKIMEDGLPSIIVDVDPVPEQLEWNAKNKEFHRTMYLLAANNGTGAMTEAMWLLCEDAYYEQGYSECGKWKRYLKKIKGEN